jgi:hypothetical protein
MDRVVIDLDATLDKQFLDISVGQFVWEIPPDSQHDDLRWKPVASERGTIHRRRLIPEMTHSDILA